MYYRLRGTITVNIINLLKANMNSNKNILNIIRFQVVAGRADSKGALGPLLSQVQINANAFCEEFNERTIV